MLLEWVSKEQPSLDILVFYFMPFCENSKEDNLQLFPHPALTTIKGFFIILHVTSLITHSAYIKNLSFAYIITVYFYPCPATLTFLFHCFVFS